MTWTVRLNFVPANKSIAASSQYIIDRETDDGVFTESQTISATKSGPVAPFALASDVDYGSDTITLESVAGLTDSADTNAGIIEDAFVRWTAIDVPNKTLTGVTWYMGYGTYAAGSQLVWACETVLKQSNEASEPSEYTVWFRIRHTLGGKTSPPAYMPVFFPPAPVSKDHCVVAIGNLQDLGLPSHMVSVDPASIKVYLAADEFHATGLLTEGESTPDQVTQPIGNAYTTTPLYQGGSFIFAQCLKDSARVALTGSKAKYKFEISGNTYSVSIPDMDFVTLLSLLTGA